MKNEAQSSIDFYNPTAPSIHATNLVARNARVYYELEQIPVVQINRNLNAFLFGCKMLEAAEV